MDGKDIQDPLHILTTVSLQSEEIRARLRTNIPINDQQSVNQNSQSGPQQVVISSMFLSTKLFAFKTTLSV